MRSEPTGAFLLPRSRFMRLLLSLALCASLVAFAGCSSRPEFATIQGQLLVNGKPADKVHIEFHPDATKGTAGPSSSGETDEEGRFELTYSYAGGNGEGAVVGHHKVAIQDLRLAESETGAGITIRFGKEYYAVGTTPLEVEVKSGHQVLTLTVPKE